MVRFNGPHVKKFKKCLACGYNFYSLIDKEKCSLCTRMFETAMERRARLYEKED